MLKVSETVIFLTLARRTWRNGAIDWKLCTRGHCHRPSTWPKFHKNCVASFVCAHTCPATPGISLKCAWGAWPFAFFLKFCTVVSIDKGNILSKFRVKKRSGSRVIGKRKFLGVADFGAWRWPPEKYFYCPFFRSVFSGLFSTDSESFVNTPPPVPELWPVSVNLCFWAGFGQVFGIFGLPGRLEASG